MTSKIVAISTCALAFIVLACDKKSPASASPESNTNAAQAAPTPPPASSDPNAPLPTTPPKGARWTSQETTFNCGVMWAGNIKEHRFEYVNKGTDTLEIYEIKPGCFCSKAENTTMKVPPAKMGRMTYRLDTSGKYGPLDETITLITNDPDRPKMIFRMIGEVKLFAEQEVIFDNSLPNGGDEKSLAALRKKLGTWDKIKPDDHLKRVLRIRNTSGQPLDIELLPMFPEKTNFKAELKTTKPHEEYELTIIGEPPFQGGLNKAVISCKTNVKEMKAFTIPLYATVPQRIEVLPTKIVVDPGMPVVLERRIAITHDGSRPFKITGLESTEQSFDLRLLPQNPAKPNQWIATLRLPDANYRPPPFGEVVRFHTTDDERPIIDVYVMPSLYMEPGERPKNFPMVFQPGIMPSP